MECGEYVTFKRKKGQGRYQRTPLKKNKKEIKVSGNRKTLAQEVLDQVKRNADTDCNAQIMRCAFNAKKSGNCESFKRGIFRKKGKLCEWIFGRLQEAYDKVAMNDIGLLSIVQDIKESAPTS